MEAIQISAPPDEISAIQNEQIAGNPEVKHTGKLFESASVPLKN